MKGLSSRLQNLEQKRVKSKEAVEGLLCIVEPRSDTTPEELAALIDERIKLGVRRFVIVPKQEQK